MPSRIERQSEQPGSTSECWAGAWAGSVRSGAPGSSEAVRSFDTSVRKRLRIGHELSLRWKRLQVVTILAVLQHLMKSVVDFKDSQGNFLFVPITVAEAI